MPDATPPFPHSATWEAFLARWRPSLDALADEGQRILGGAILDLGWQAHMNRHAIRNFETVAQTLIDEVFGQTSMVDHKRHGGALDRVESNVLARMDAKDEADAASRRSLIRWIVGVAVSVAMLVVTAIGVLIAVVK